MTSHEFEEILSDIYEKYDNKIRVKIFDARRSDRYSTFTHTNRLNNSISRILNSFQGEFIDTTKKYLNSIAREQADRLKEEYPNISASKKDILDRVAPFLKDRTYYIENHVRKMKKDLLSALKHDGALIGRYALAGGVSRREALNELRGSLQDNIIRTKFVNRRGAKYDSEFYFRTLVKTFGQEFRNSIYIDSLVENKIDLVKISSHGAKDRCRRWEGVIISLTGSTKGYPTFEQSRLSGDIWHPNCRHFLIPVGGEDGV